MNTKIDLAGACAGNDNDTTSARHNTCSLDCASNATNTNKLVIIYNYDDDADNKRKENGTYKQIICRHK